MPRSVRGNFLSATEIFLEWDNIPIEDQNGLIIAYNITYKMKHSADVWESTMNSTSRTVSIKGLAYYTIYEFKVAGKTAVGQGPFSSPVDIRTDAHGMMNILSFFMSRPYPTVAGLSDTSFL